MSSRSKYRSAFEKHRVISPLYTGGPVALTSNGRRLLTSLGEHAVFTNIEDGAELCRFHADDETIYSMCFSPSTSHLLLFTASLSLHIYDVPHKFDNGIEILHPKRTIHRAHDAPVHVCKVDPSSTFLASGSADGVVKVWDILRGYVTHSFRGHGGVVSALAFNYPSYASPIIAGDATMELITASVDTYIRIFDLSQTSSNLGNMKAITVLEGHVSVPRGLDVSTDGRWLVSGGRDSVVLIWDLSLRSSGGLGSKKEKKKSSIHTLFKTIPVFQRVEAIGIISNNAFDDGGLGAETGLLFYIGGEKGSISIWDAWEGRVLYTIPRDISAQNQETRQILAALHSLDATVVVSVHADQTILCNSIADGTIYRQLVGFNDEITDVTFLSLTGPDSHLALAVNSPLIRIYTTSTQNCQLLPGHNDIILALQHDASGHFLATGSKDNTARIWLFSPVTKEFECVSVLSGHTASVGALAFSHTSPDHKERFLFTGSHDQTIKMWDLSGIQPDSSSNLSGADSRPRSLVSIKAHEKDINCLDVAPNNQFLASGSQDRTIKLFRISYSGSGHVGYGELVPVGSCIGHKRGVWTIKFGKAERVLASGSGDKTIKLWNLNDFTCVRTLQGHSNSVLRLNFFNQDMQIASTGSDALLKIWNIRDEECIATMDNHEDKIWALDISSDERTIVTGGADSVVTFWIDCTEEKEARAEEERVKNIRLEQDFNNYVTKEDYIGALQLALVLNQPGRLYRLFYDVVHSKLSPITSDKEGITGNTEVDKILQSLAPPQLSQLFRHIQTWNSKTDTATVAQLILHAILKLRTAEEILSSLGDRVIQKELHDGTAGSIVINETLQALIPYSERYLNRMDRFIQESYVTEFVLAEMDGGIFTDADGQDE